MCRWPPYASYIALELVYNTVDKSHGVRMMYNDEYLTMLGSDQEIIHFDTFREKLRERMRPAAWEKMCRYCREPTVLVGGSV
jgi:hypothetical protein